jgi:hypothetical protein
MTRTPSNFTHSGCSTDFELAVEKVKARGPRSRQPLISGWQFGALALVNDFFSLFNFDPSSLLFSVLIQQRSYVEILKIYTNPFFASTGEHNSHCHIEV